MNPRLATLQFSVVDLSVSQTFAANAFLSFPYFCGGRSSNSNTSNSSSSSSSSNSSSSSSSSSSKSRSRSSSNSSSSSYI
ncbi:hypothetical protein E2C01_080022 [Portunus trituberculatus]|uniref:Uncharacterized protein n=1 Tax=Portunus trituberculatus TaxID=210409 RepID=A0A5B7IUW0_PORTR|nr:hypothetical protein [Portunus trituberculatus]